MQHTLQSDFLITNCNGNIDLDHSKNINNLDAYFNQDVPYKFPPLIICDDTKSNSHSQDIYKQYSDIIYDECGNRFNIRNTRDSSGVLQAGYSANIDLDSHLKNINYYNDKCYYDNWKLSPKSATNHCNGIYRNAQILTPDYTPVGRNYNDCLGQPLNNQKNNTVNTINTVNTVNTQNNNQPQPKINTCWNSPPTDINYETDVRKRYNFDNNKLQMASCIKPNEWKPFMKVPNTNTTNTTNTPITIHNNTKREKQLLDSITQNTQHDFYKFFDNSQCVIFPNQRLFNNITKRSMLPNHHFSNIDPIHIK